MTLRIAPTLIALFLSVVPVAIAQAPPTPTPVVSAAAGVPPSVDLPAALARVLTDYEKAWTAKDAKALAGLFAEDGWVLSNGRPPVQGRAAIEKRYEGSGGPLALRALAYATGGPIGYIVGGFATKRDDPDVGKFTLTLRRGPGGAWLIYSDMDNGNSRP